MAAYTSAKYLAKWSLAPKSRPEAIVESNRPMERYDIKVLSLANQTLASTLTGVGIFSSPFSDELYDVTHLAHESGS